MNPTTEIWKSVLGYEGSHEVSNQGRVRSLDRVIPSRWKTPMQIRGRVIFQFLWGDTTRQRYWHVRLHRNGSIRCFTVHSLVAKAFHANPHKLPEVNHKDGNKHNNNDWNLEWCTRHHNNQHALDIGLRTTRGEGCHFAKITESVALRVRQLARDGKRNYVIAGLLGVKAANVSAIVLRKSWRHLPVGG